jgi:predicted alpha/beta hydrolase family esterase
LKELAVNLKALATIVIVPGLRDHVPEHWQTLLEAKLARTRAVVSVPPLREDGLNCAARVEAIQKTVHAIDGPIIFAAHSGGVIMLLHWAQKYRHAVQGALLAAPPDFETPLPAGYPTLETLQANGWLPVPTKRLPFASLVAASTNDPLASFASVETMATNWGATLVNVGAVGHLNPASGFGEWLRAEPLLQQIDNGYFL